MSDEQNVTAVKIVIDWIAVEADYRSGIKTLRQIGEERGVSHVAVGKRAKKESWTRDLAAKIKAQADAKVTKSAVTKEVTSHKAVTEKQVVEANAELQYQIRIEHRHDIKRSRDLMKTLFTEVEITSQNKELFETLGELLDESGPDSNGTWRKDAMNDLYKKVISLTGRVDNSKKLVEMLEKLIKLERQAFGITDGETSASGSDDLVMRLGKTA